MKRARIFLSGWLLFGIQYTQAQVCTEIQQFDQDAVVNNQSFGLSMSPDRNTVYFVQSFGGREKLQLMQSEKIGGKWTRPQPAFFSRAATKEIDPFVSPDGQTILYNSRRSVTNDKDKDFDVWMLKKQNGQWSNPFAVDAINTGANETYATMSSNGNIYFGVTKEGGYGGGDIFVSRFDGRKYLPPENIGFPVNTDKDEGNCFIAPDESYMIFSANGYTSCFGGFDLYISFNQAGKWSTPINLGEKINTAENDFCPTIFGKDTLIFARSRKEGEKLIENIYSTRLNIPLLRSMISQQAAPVFDKIFPEGDVYGITFSPDGKTVFTTRSNESRSVCEVYSIQQDEQGNYSNPEKMNSWNITNNVSNPVISYDNSFALLRVSVSGMDPDLLISRNVSGSWLRPVPLPSYINTLTDQYYPELTPENHLYYSSSGDVFYAPFENGRWQQPTPVTELNSPFSESNIAISRDGMFLVFLSDRTGGYGSYDLFISKKTNGLWSDPINLGPGINSSAMEYQPRFSLDNSTLYFTRSVFKDGKRQGKDQVLKVTIADILENLRIAGIRNLPEK